MRTDYILGTVIVSIAAALPVILYLKIHRVRRFLKNATATRAQIYYVEERRSSKSTYYFVQLKYLTIETGKEYTGQTVFGKKHVAGDQINIWYKRNDPSVFKTDTRKWLRWVLFASIVFAIIICCLIYSLLY